MAGLTNTTQLANSLQVHFSKQLLDRIIPSLVFHEFAFRSPLPGKSGSKSIRMFRFDAPSIAGVIGGPLNATPLLEGTPADASTYRQLSLEYIEVPLKQYIQTIAITDVADATSLFNLIEQANTQNAEDAALHCDTVTQFELAKQSGSETGGLNYANKKFFYGDGLADYTALDAAADATAIMTAETILDAATALKVANAPKISGTYVAALPPQITRDIMAGSGTNTTWVDVSKYSAKEQLFNGEVGKLYGIKVLEHTNPYRSAATPPGTDPATNYNPAGAIFSGFVFGRHAYGVSDLKTLGSPFAPGVFVVSGADKSDPANLIRALVSWKAFWAAKLLQPKWLVHIFTKSGYA